MPHPTSPRSSSRPSSFTVCFLLLFAAAAFWTLRPSSSETIVIPKHRPSSSSSLDPASSSPNIMATSRLRLAILLADTPQPDTNAKYGGYRGVFTTLLDTAAASLDPPQSLDALFDITAYDVVNDTSAYPAVEDVDAVLITGSRHNAFDDDPWILALTDFTRRAIESGRVRVVGVCFGHQIVGRAAGAKLERSDKGWEIAVTEVDLTEEGKKLLGLDKMRIQQMHRDIVADFPPDSVPLGSNEICKVQGMYKPKTYITVQGHPEFKSDIMGEILRRRHEGGIFADDVYKEAMSRHDVPHDGIAIARAFIHFMRDD